MGMARTFYTLMSNPSEHFHPKAIFEDIQNTICQIMTNAYQMNNGQVLTASTYDLALSNIENIPLSHYHLSTTI